MIIHNGKKYEELSGHKRQVSLYECVGFIFLGGWIKKKTENKFVDTKWPDSFRISLCISSYDFKILLLHLNSKRKK